MGFFQVYMAVENHSGLLKGTRSDPPLVQPLPKMLQALVDPPVLRFQQFTNSSRFAHCYSMSPEFKSTLNAGTGFVGAAWIPECPQRRRRLWRGTLHKLL